jgi:hypothetical protein
MPSALRVLPLVLRRLLLVPGRPPFRAPLSRHGL